MTIRRPSGEKATELIAALCPLSVSSSRPLAANAPVPADAVTASASGLDPHISPQNAELQALRVARGRGLEVAQVRALIARHTDPADFGVLGEPGVNVLELNLALDAAGRVAAPNARPQGR